MKIIFLSNYFTHHQAPFCEEIIRHCKNSFLFVETSHMTEERIKMGWKLENPQYVVNVSNKIFEDKNLSNSILDADVVILGDAPFSYVSKRVEMGKLTFIYTERIFKDLKSILKLPYYYLRIGQKYRGKKNLYLLCAGSFVYRDFLLLRCFKNKAYKWGYFPKYESNTVLIDNVSSRGKIKLLWTARFLKWKHPELALKLVKVLVERGYNIDMIMIGQGPLLQQSLSYIKNERLQNYVTLIEKLTPEEVRVYMKRSDIFLFTSDRYEGWGAVLNEAMNSGCVPVVSDKIGSAGYLIDDRKNGLLFRSGRLVDLITKVTYLLDNTDTLRSMSLAANQTITKVWNEKVAASNFIHLVSEIEKGNDTPFVNGPCSKA